MACGRVKEVIKLVQELQFFNNRIAGCFYRYDQFEARHKDSLRVIQ